MIYFNKIVEFFDRFAMQQNDYNQHSRTIDSGLFCRLNMDTTKPHQVGRVSAARCEHNREKR